MEKICLNVILNTKHEVCKTKVKMKFYYHDI